MGGRPGGEEKTGRVILEGDFGKKSWLAGFLEDSLATGPFFFLWPALLLWLFGSGSRSCQSGSLSSFPASFPRSFFLVLLNDGFQVLAAVAPDPFEFLAIEQPDVVAVQLLARFHVAAEIA